MPKVQVAKKNQLGGCLKVESEGRAILLVTIDGRTFAIDAVCSHSGGPLEEGEVDGTTIVCPLHQAEFDVTTVKVSPETPWAKDLGSYPVSIEGNAVFVDLPKDEAPDEPAEALPEIEVAAGPPPEALHLDYNPLDPEYRENPYPLLHRALEEKPIFYSPGFNLWVATRYDDLWTILKNPDVFSSEASTAVLEEPPKEVVEILGEGYPFVNTLVTNDPPSHTRFRGLVNKAFTPRRVAEKESHIREVANELVDRFHADGRVDLIWNYAYPLPMRIIAGVLGVPDRDMDVFKKWSDHLVEQLSAMLPVEKRVECARSAVEFQHYFAERLEERRKEPRDDMLTDLLNARLEGAEPLTTAEMLSILQQILVAGNETTTNLIGSLVVLLLQNPEAIEAIRKDPRLATNAVEEALRLETPVQGLFRVARRDVEVGGVAIPKGAQIQVLYSAGNRDERRFPKPDAFDLGRKNASSHLSFGGGVHFCLGAALSRLEAKITVETLMDRLPNLRLAGGETLEHTPHFFLRGLRHLNVEWDVA